MFCLEVWVTTFFILTVVPKFATCENEAHLTSGTEYMVMFMSNVVEESQNYNMELFVATLESNVHVVVKSPWESFENTFTISVGETKMIELPSSVRQTHDQTGIERKGILVRATKDIVLHGINKDQYSADAFLALPVTALGTEYYTISYAPPTTSCEFGVVGVFNSTDISIMFSSPEGEPINIQYGGQTYGNGAVLNVSLNQYDSLQIQSKGDLTGTRILSSTKVAVFSGNARTAVAGQPSRDHLVEQIPPVSSWGSKFITVPTPNRTVGDIFRVLAFKDNTQVSVTEKESFTIHAGKHKEIDIPSNLHAVISATEPVLVAQFIKSQFPNANELSDPSMIIIPPVEQYGSSFSVITPRHSSGINYKNYALMIVRKEDKDGLLQDGQPLSSVSAVRWYQPTGEDYFAGSFLVTPGVHYFNHPSPNSQFTLFLYGTEDKETYGFPVGQHKLPVQPTVDQTTVRAFVRHDPLTSSATYHSDSASVGSAATTTSEYFEGNVTITIPPNDKCIKPSAGDHRGTEFLLVFMENKVEDPQRSSMEIYVTTPFTKANVQLSAPFYNHDLNQRTVVVPGTYHTFKVASSVKQIGTSLTMKALLLESDQEISVYANNKETFSSDSFLALPTDVLGKEYFAVCYAPPLKRCQFAIAGVYDGTKVEITFAKKAEPPIMVEYAGKTYTNGQMLLATLNRYDTLQIQSKEDLTGTYIKANYAVVVLSGNVRTSVGNSLSSDHIVEQLPPVKDWGRHFVTVPEPKRSLGALFRLVASENNTNIDLSYDNKKVSLDAGEFYEIRIPPNIYASINASSPILVVQIIYSQFDASEPSDPSLVLIPAIAQYTDQYEFAVAATPGGTLVAEFNHYLLLAVQNNEKEEIYLDGKPVGEIPDMLWNRVPKSEYVGTWISVQKGVHNLKHRLGTARFMAILYGAAPKESYGMVLGMSLPLEPNPPVPSPTKDIDTSTCTTQHNSKYEWALVGIAVSGMFNILFIILLLFLVCWPTKRNRKRRDSNPRDIPVYEEPSGNGSVFLRGHLDSRVAYGEPIRLWLTNVTEPPYSQKMTPRSEESTLGRDSVSPLINSEDDPAVGSENPAALY